MRRSPTHPSPQHPFRPPIPLAAPLVAAAESADVAGAGADEALDMGEGAAGEPMAAAFGADGAALDKGEHEEEALLLTDLVAYNQSYQVRLDCWACVGGLCASAGRWQQSHAN